MMIRMPRPPLDKQLAGTKPGGMRCGHTSRRAAAASLLTLLLMVGTGCTQVGTSLAYNDGLDSLITGWRNTTWATQAWHRHKCQFDGQPYMKDCRAGFRDGYMGIAAGGDGCNPVLPPRRYWSWRYQSAEGQGRVAAWFDAYPHGARAAEEDGIGNWSQIQFNPRPVAEVPPELLPTIEPIPAAPSPSPPPSPALDARTAPVPGPTLHMSAYQATPAVINNTQRQSVGGRHPQPPAAQVSWNGENTNGRRMAVPVPQPAAATHVDPRLAQHMQQRPAWMSSN